MGFAKTLFPTLSLLVVIVSSIATAALFLWSFQNHSQYENIGVLTVTIGFIAAVPAIGMLVARRLAMAREAKLSIRRLLGATAIVSLVALAVALVFDSAVMHKGQLLYVIPCALLLVSASAFALLHFFVVDDGSERSVDNV